MKAKVIFLSLLTLVLLSSAVLGAPYMNISLLSPANDVGTTDRTPDFSFRPVSDDPNATSLICNLTIGSTTQPVDMTVVNNTIKTKTALRLADGVYYWNVTCEASTNASFTNTSLTRNITVGFASYTSGDIATVIIDSYVGLLAFIFSVVALIGIAIVWNMVKGRKKLLNV